VAKNHRDLGPAERLLLKWANVHKEGEPEVADFDDEFSKTYPNLWVLLTWKAVGDLKKLPGTITIKTSGTAFEARYYDPTQKMGCAAIATTMREALARLDLAVVDANTVWSTSRQQKAWRTEKKKV